MSDRHDNRSGQHVGNRGQRAAHAPADAGGKRDRNEHDRIRFAKPLNAELFNSIAQEEARRVAGADGSRNKPTQLCRFYDELCLWEMKVRQKPEKFSEYLPFIRMLNAKVAYAEGRRLVDPTFVGLMHHALAEVTDAETLSVCKLFWEAFMGFYKQARQD